MSEKKQPGKPRNGKLKIELSFHDAIKAALETPPEQLKAAPKSRKARKAID